MTTLTPVGNLVLIKLVEEKDVKQGGIYLPSGAANGPKKAQVVAVGKKDIPAEVKVGATVLIDYAGGEVLVDGVKHYLLNVEHVLAVVE